MTNIFYEKNAIMYGGGHIPAASHIMNTIVFCKCGYAQQRKIGSK